VLSGDNEGEIFLKHYYLGTELIFDQKPKLEFIKQLQEQGRNDDCDGLNDVGALQSNVGILFQKMSMFSHQLVMGF
jgi:ABC-type polar amino acid transport system ATPase subunit